MRQYTSVYVSEIEYPSDSFTSMKTTLCTNMRTPYSLKGRPQNEVLAQCLVVSLPGRQEDGHSFSCQFVCKVTGNLLQSITDDFIQYTDDFHVENVVVELW